MNKLLFVTACLMAAPVTAMNTARKNLFNIQPAPAVQAPIQSAAPVLPETPGAEKNQIKNELNVIFRAIDALKQQLRTNLTENMVVPTVQQIRQSINALTETKGRILVGDTRLRNLAAHVTEAENQVIPLYAQQLRNLVIQFATDVALDDGTMLQDQVQQRFNIYAEAFFLLNEFLQRDPQYQPTLQEMEAALTFVKDTLE